jgi:hypothetical protein
MDFEASTKALIKAAKTLKKEGKSFTVVLDCDAVRFVFALGDVTQEIDVCELVKQVDAQPDNDFAENVTEVLDEDGVEYETWC